MLITFISINRFYEFLFKYRLHLMKVVFAQINKYVDDMS